MSSDPDNKAKVDELMKRLGDMAGGNIPGNIIIPGQEPNPAEKMELLLNYLNAMEEGIGRLGIAVQRMAYSSDHARLSIQMMQRILVERGIISRSEIQDKYKTEVADVMESVMAQVHNAAKAASEGSRETNEKEDTGGPQQDEASKPCKEACSKEGPCSCGVSEEAVGPSGVTGTPDSGEQNSPA